MKLHAFVAMPFGTKPDADGKPVDFNRIYDELLRPALEQAGLDVIRADEEEGGVLEFGTEIIAAHDSSLVALLGASPGASTSVSIAFDILSKCFESNMKSRAWKKKLSHMIPTYGKSLEKNAALVAKTRKHSAKYLKLK